MQSRPRDWLEGLGLEHLSPMFEEHQVDFRDLELLTDKDLREIRLVLGPRKRVLEAIAGETPNPATRLEGLARRNTIAITDVTYSLVEGLFECSNLGPLGLKGIAQPVHVYRVLGESSEVALRGFS
ncbi:MAG: hypothetical protein ACR2PG_18800 [Hyphomicrobiaceae bacterium]